MKSLPPYITTTGPLVSIVIPTYNVGAYLKRCFQSIQNQTYKNFEVVIMDDCSTDNSFAVGKEQEKSDERFRAYRMTANSGAGDTRQAAIELTKGEMICFVDGDDWLDENYLAVLYGILKSTGADIACCQQYFYDETTGEINTPWPYNNKVMEMTSVEAMKKMKWYDRIDESLWNKLYRREVIMRHKMITAPFEDGLVLYKYFSNADTVAVCGIPLYWYFQREGSLMHMRYTPQMEFARFEQLVLKDKAISGERRLTCRTVRLHIRKGMKMLREFSLLEQSSELDDICRDLVQFIRSFDSISIRHLGIGPYIARTISYVNVKLYMAFNRKITEMFNRKRIDKVRYKYSLLTMEVFQKGL